MSKHKRSKQERLNDDVVLDAIYSGKHMLNTLSESDVNLGLLSRSAQKLALGKLAGAACNCPSCKPKEAAEGADKDIDGSPLWQLVPNAGENKRTRIVLMDTAQRSLSGSLLLDPNDYTLRANGNNIQCAGHFIKLSKNGSLASILSPASSAEAKRLLPLMQMAYAFLAEDASFDFTNAIPTEQALPLWDQAPKVKNELSQQLKMICEYQVLSVYPTWFRYCSDGDFKSQKHILRPSFGLPGGLPAGGSRAIIPLLYDGLAWCVWLAYADVPLSTRVFLTLDLKKVIASDDCMRDAQSSYDAIDLYSPYSNAAMNLLQWCAGPGMTRISGKLAKGRVFTLDNRGNAPSLEELRKIFFVKALLENPTVAIPVGSVPTKKFTSKKKPAQYIACVPTYGGKTILYWGLGKISEVEGTLLRFSGAHQWGIFEKDGTLGDCNRNPKPYANFFLNQAQRKGLYLVPPKKITLPTLEQKGNV